MEQTVLDLKHLPRGPCYSGLRWRDRWVEEQLAISSTYLETRHLQWGQTVQHSMEAISSDPWMPDHSCSSQTQLGTTILVLQAQHHSPTSIWSVDVPILGLLWPSKVCSAQIWQFKPWSGWRHSLRISFHFRIPPEDVAGLEGELAACPKHHLWE